MIILLPFLWLVLWTAISVLICAFLGLSPAGALRTGSLIFMAGGFGLPLAGWLLWRRRR